MRREWGVSRARKNEKGESKGRVMGGKNDEQEASRVPAKRCAGRPFFQLVILAGSAGAGSDLPVLET